MIRLNQLLKEETFTATNKQSGKTSVFKSKDSRDAAIKAGTHNPIKDTEQPSAPKAAGNSMFGGDYAKDRGGEAPKANDEILVIYKNKARINKTKSFTDAKAAEKFADANSGTLAKMVNGKLVAYPKTTVLGKGEEPNTKVEPKSDMGVDSVVYNKRTKTVGIVRMADERGETKTDADGNVNTDELEPYNPMKYPHQKDAQVAPSTTKEIDSRGLWKPFSQSNSTTSNEKSQYDEPTYWKDEKKYYDEEDDVEKTSDRLDKVEKALSDDLKLEDNGFETTRESGGGQGGWEGPMTIIDKNSDYDNGYNCLSIGSGENDGKFSIGFYNQDGEPVFDDEDYGSLTGEKVLSAKQTYKIGKALMGMPEVQKFIKGEITSDEFAAVHDKIKSKLNKSTNEGIIRLTKLMESDPCWKGYKQVGMKDKNGREVPNCVPEGVVNELGGISSIHKLYLAVSENHRKLKADQLAMAKKYNNETDPAKKAKLMDMLKKGTEKLRTVADNLSGVEERYIMSIDKDAELDLNPF